MKNNIKCLICGNDEFACIHRGTRDIANINVMKCKNCGMVQLDSSLYNTEENYRGGYAESRIFRSYGQHVRHILGNMDTRDRTG